MSHRTPHGAMRGFSLVEIMVAVVVICVGLLGIAKMQALAVSSTTTARLRAMAAFQAASLASAMHSNRAFWASAAAVANSPVTINLPVAPATAVTVTPAGFAQVDTLCIAAAAGAVPACPNVAQLAGFDVQRWGEALVPPNGGSLLPNLQTQITCQGAVQPPSCIIQMRWTEQTGTINSSEQSLAIVDPTMTGNCPTGTNCDYYTLYVEP